MNQKAIYVHVPWCRRRCPYCNFYIVVGKPDQRFAKALMNEWAGRAPLWHQGMASSLYFGGGTPSLLAPAQISLLVNYFIKEEFLDPHAEVTIEANPEDINDHYVAELKKSGVTRISLGTQSFDNKILKTLGRKHSNTHAESAIDILFNHNFKNISVDLIIGVPGENLKNLEKTLHMLAERNISHLSAYLLTIEEKTNFHKRIAEGRLIMPQEECQVKAYKLVQKMLKKLGYEQYDISSFARPGFMSRHNQVYWAQGTYVGLGPGAHSMRFLNDGGVERAQNCSKLMPWLLEPLAKSHYEYDHLSKQDALKEALAFGLRNMHTGIDPEVLAKRHQCSLPTEWPLIIEKLCNYGWLHKKASGHIIISSYGALFADAIMREIVCA